MRHLSPLDSNAYISIASMYLVLNRRDEAATALLQTLITDQNRSDARQALIDLYRQQDRQGCALTAVAGQSQPSINVDCPMVHGHLCAAYQGIAQALWEAREPVLAEQYKQAAVNTYRCAPDQFERPPPDSTQPTNPAHE